MTSDATGQAAGETPARKPDPRLLELLVCPLTKATLLYDQTRSELVSLPALLAYPIRNGVPIMLIDEARKLDDDDIRRWSR
jgi:uncharacterized protein